MKLMKVILCIMLVIGLTFSFAGCSLKAITGGMVDVDKDGNVKIQGEDGEIEIGKAKWEGSKMYSLDQPKAKLESYVSADGTTMYSFSEMKGNDAEAYINKIKEAGFTYSTLVMDDYSFTGTNKEGQTISFTYDKGSGSGTIIAGQGEKPSDDDNGEGAVIGGSNKQWDSNNMGGLPDPGAAIATYWSVDGDTSYTFEKIDNHLEYVEKIKACGYTVDSSVMEVNDTYIYSASNENGDRVTFSSSSEGGTITFEKYK